MEIRTESRVEQDEEKGCGMDSTISQVYGVAFSHVKFRA